MDATLIELGNFRLACRGKSRAKGLLGRSSSNAVLLVPCKDIHTFGMRSAIDVAFVSEDGEVLLSRRGLKPKRRLRCSHAAYVVERFSKDGKRWLEKGDRVVWRLLLENARPVDGEL